jgi:hypothetical protein
MLQQGHDWNVSKLLAAALYSKLLSEIIYKISLAVWLWILKNVYKMLSVGGKGDACGKSYRDKKVVLTVYSIYTQGIKRV